VIWHAFWMLVPAYITALAALITAVFNGLRWRAHGQLDDRRFREQGERIDLLANGHGTQP
jgi:hypothetical protein